MHISYKPLWHTLVERGLTTNMIANMGKGKEINFDMLVPICKYWIVILQMLFVWCKMVKS